MYPWIRRTLDFWLQFCENKCGLYMDVYGILSSIFRLTRQYHVIICSSCQEMSHHSWVDVNIKFCYTHSFSLHVPRKWCWQKSHWYQRRQIFWNQPCWTNSSVTSQRWLQFITNHRAHLWKVVLRQEDSHYLPELNLHQVWSPSVSIVILIGNII